MYKKDIKSVIIELQIFITTWTLLQTGFRASFLVEREKETLLQIPQLQKRPQEVSFQERCFLKISQNSQENNE